MYVYNLIMQLQQYIVKIIGYSSVDKGIFVDLEGFFFKNKYIKQFSQFALCAVCVKNRCTYCWNRWQYACIYIYISQKLSVISVWNTYLCNIRVCVRNNSNNFLQGVRLTGDLWQVMRGLGMFEHPLLNTQIFTNIFIQIANVVHKLKLITSMFFVT